MKKLLLALLLLSSYTEVFGQQPSFVRSYNQTGNENFSQCAYDRSNNLIVAGNRIINPGNGGATHSSNIWVRKYSPTGSVLWTVQTTNTLNSGAESVEITSVVTDSLDNIYIAGFFLPGDISIGGQGYVAANDNSINLFYAKINPQGVVVWIKGVNEWQHPQTRVLTHALTISPDGHLILAGGFNNEIIVGNDTLTLPTTASSPATRYGFYSKMNLDGVPIWTKWYDAPSNSAVNSKGYINTMTADKRGNIFFNITKDTIITINNTTINNPGKLGLVKIDSTGVVVNNLALPTSIFDIKQIIVDHCDNLLITGYFENSFTLGNTTLTTSSIHDIYVAKFDNDFNLLWLKQYASSEPDNPGAIAVNDRNDILLAFEFRGTINYGTPFTATNLNDAILMKLDEDGNYIWHKHTSGPSYTSRLSVSVAPNNRVALTGVYAGQQQFDQIAINSSSPTNKDVFVATYIDNMLAPQVHNCFPSSLNIENIAPHTGLKIYPNPANDWMTIEIPTQNQSYQVQVVDISGREIYQGQNSGNTHSIPVKELPEGMYLVNVSFSDGTTNTQRFVVKY